MCPAPLGPPHGRSLPPLPCPRKTSTLKHLFHPESRLEKEGERIHWGGGHLDAHPRLISPGGGSGSVSRQSVLAHTETGLYWPQSLPTPLHFGPVSCCPTLRGGEARGWTCRQSLKEHVERRTTGLLDGQAPARSNPATFVSLPQQLSAQVPGTPSPPGQTRCRRGLDHPHLLEDKQTHTLEASLEVWASCPLAAQSNIQGKQHSNELRRQREQWLEGSPGSSCGRLHPTPTNADTNNKAKCSEQHISS